jgi:hypothetical protein
VAPVAVPENWYSVHKLPKGRMFEQETRVRALATGAPELTALAQSNPDL